MRQLDLLFSAKPRPTIHPLRIRRSETAERAAARERRALLHWLRMIDLGPGHPAPQMVINLTRRHILHDLGGLGGVW